MAENLKNMTSENPLCHYCHLHPSTQDREGRAGKTEPVRQSWKSCDWAVKVVERPYEWSELVIRMPERS